MKLQSAGNWILRNQETILLVATLFLFTSKSLYNITFSLMALLGLYRLCRSPGLLLSRPETRFYGLLFFSLWIPMAIAFVDPVNLERCARTVWPYLRFILAGYYVFTGLGKQGLRTGLENGFFLVVTVWSLDGLLQFFTGRNIFGYPYLEGVHITGMFYPDPVIGHVLAGVSALYFDSLRKRSGGRPGIWLLLIPLFMVVFLSGRRSVWLMLAVSSLGYVGWRYYLAESGRRFLGRAGMIGAALAVVLAALFFTQDPVRQRVDKTMGLFSGDIEAIDAATSRRVDLWITSWRMFRENWFNGIGPRGYRYVYQDYADEGFSFYETGQTHPHMLILEIMAETGVVGLAGYALFLYLLFSAAWNHRRDESCVAGLIGIFAAAFPLNSHVAFYGSYWSSLLWWMIIYLAVHMAAPPDGQADRRETAG